MKHLIGSISLAAMLIGGCSNSPSPPPLPGPAQTHDVKLTLGGAEVASMPGPFCQPQDDAAGTGSRCDDGRKRMEALAKSRNIPQITPPVTMVFPGMEPPAFALKFSEQPTRYTVTQWGAHPLADPPGVSWLYQPLTVSPAGAFPVPRQPSSPIYEVVADWADGSSNSYLFPLATTDGYLDLNTFTVSDVILGLVDGVVHVDAHGIEAETYLKPVVAALKAAKLETAPPPGGTPDFSVALDNHANVALTLESFKGKGVLVTAGAEKRWTTSEALLAALEPLGAKAPKPPLIGRAKVEAIARAYDSTMKWDPPVFSEGMRFTVNGERAVRPVWVAAGGQSNGNRLTLYIDPLTGAIWSQERVFKGG